MDWVPQAVMKIIIYMQIQNMPLDYLKGHISKDIIQKWEQEVPVYSVHVSKTRVWHFKSHSKIKVLKLIFFS